MIVYVGQYISERMRERRGLPTLNVAGTNRMRRIAEALCDAGETCCILAPGASARLRWRHRLVHRGGVEHKRGVPVIYSSALGVPFLSVMWAPLAVIGALLTLKKRCGIDGVIVYNYRFLEFLTAFFGRAVLKVPVLLDLEDISIPKWNDFRHDSETSASRQLRFWPLMKATILACHAVFAPTVRFREAVPSAKPFEVISGCMRVPSLGASELRGVLRPISETCPLVVLFSGKIECEHGVDVLAEAIRLLDATSLGTRYVFHICGSGPELPRLREAMASLKWVRVNIHGFVSNQAFARLFESSEVCLVLQRPKGRQSQYKTPSKGYEAMCAGKALLVSEVGDFGELPHEVCLRVNPYTAEQLASQLAGLTREKVRQYSMNAESYARLNWESCLCGRRIAAMLLRHRRKEELTA